MINSIKIVAISVIIIALIGTFWWITGLRGDLAKSRQNEEILQSSIVDQQNVIDNLQRDYEDITNVRNVLESIIYKQTTEINELQKKFDRNIAGKERDIGKLAIEKPNLIQSIINRSSNKEIRCIELATGSIPTKDEENNEKDFISRCQSNYFD